MSAAVRLRTIGATALCALAGGLGMPWGFQALLPLSERLRGMLLVGYLVGAAILTLVVAIATWIGLWPATPYLALRADEPEPRGAEPREAKAALLSFPVRVATAGTAAGELAVVAGWLTLTVAGEPPDVVLGLSLITASVVALGWLLLYTICQRAVQPLQHRLRSVALPPGEAGGVGLRARLAYALAVVIFAGVIPAAVFANVYLDRIHTTAEREKTARLASWLQQASQGLSPEAADRFVEAVPLTQGFPGPWPVERLGLAGKSPEAPQRQVLLPGGKRLYLPPQPPSELPVGILISLTLLLLCAGALSVVGAGAVARDVLALTAQVTAQVQGQGPGHGPVAPPQQAEALSTAEARQIATALTRLMDRMRRLHVESYLAIERTIDARRAKSQFLASMSHDLRSPLSSVLGFAELLSSGYEGDIPAPAGKRLQHIHKTGRRLLKLLSEILDTAKVESQTIELHPRRCVPSELLAQAVSEARRGRLSDDIPVVLDIAPGMPAVSVDPVRYPQALAHLIGHVLDGTNAEASEHQLRLRARQGTQAPAQAQGPSSAASPTSALAAGPPAKVSGSTPMPTFEVEVSVERAPTARAGAEPMLPLGTVGLGLALPLARRLIALHGGTIEIAPSAEPPAQGAPPRLIAVVPMRLSG